MGPRPALFARGLIIAAGLAALAACAGGADRAEDKYETIPKDRRFAGERCAAAKEVKEAYLDKGDQEQFKHWHLVEAADCGLASL